MNPLMMAMNDNNNRMAQAIQIMNQLKSGNPEQIFQNMMQNNQQFQRFMEQNRGKTPEQVARENGVDLSQFKSLM